MTAPVEGAVLRCELTMGKKGPQVARVFRADAAAAAGAPPARAEEPAEPAADEVVCRVRWYCGVRNYGFLIPEDGSPDVFVDAATLRRSRIMSLDEGQVVAGKVVMAPRGREARAVRLL
jgi:CspA family cold shock protein